MNDPAVLIAIGLFGLAMGLWLLLPRWLRGKGGPAGELGVDTGQLVRQSGWGSGMVNGIQGRGCVRVAEYENGWVVRLVWPLGSWFSRLRLAAFGEIWPRRSGRSSTTSH